MNQKIQCLIDGGFISIQDVLEYAQMYMDAMDQYDDEQIDKYGSELDYGMTEEDRMEMLNDMYEDELTPADLRSPNPQYIIASTSYMMEETYIFEANEDGVITNYGEYGGIALRFGDGNWTNRNLAVERVFGNVKYDFVRDVSMDVIGIHHSLYVRVIQEDEQEHPLPSDTYDGGVVQEP